MWGEEKKRGRKEDRTSKGGRGKACLQMAALKRFGYRKKGKSILFRPGKRPMTYIQRAKGKICYETRYHGLSDESH